MWFWEYKLKIYNSDLEEEFEIRNGLVTGSTLTEAMEKLESYYVDEIEEVQMLKAIIDEVFDFQLVRDEQNFDYSIIKKLKKVM